MDDKRKTWAIRIGVGAGACALLTAWMVPNTTPVGRPSPLAGMASVAEAQRPTYSAVPDTAIPAWAANLKQVPAAPMAPRTPTVAPPAQTADASDVSMSIPDPAPAPDETTPVDATPAGVASPASPAPEDAYLARRAEWQSRVNAVMQGQRNPNDG